MLFLALAVALSGCANRQPPEPIRPLAKIALLPMTYPQARDGWRPPGAGYVSPQPMSPGAAAGVIGIGLIALAVTSAKQQETDKLAAAVAAVGFDPVPRFNERLLQRLEAAGLQIVRISDTEARALRDEGDYTPLATRADAVLDPQLSDVGYYDAGRGRGLSPMLGMTLTINTTGVNYNSLWFEYWADWRSEPKNTRWLTTPPTQSYADPAALTANAADARAGLEATLDRLIDRIVDDVKLRAAGQKPV
jgi:hypothetical protein